MAVTRTGRSIEQLALGLALGAAGCAVSSTGTSEPAAAAGTGTVGAAEAAASGVRAGGADVAFRWVEDEEHGKLALYEGEAPVLAWAFGDQLRAGVPADRTRSCYLHPIWGLDGEVLTDDFPDDHHHHRGLSLMWPRMKVGDRDVELWHIKGIRAHFREWLEKSVADDGAVLAVANDWILDDGQVVGTETLRVRVHPAGPYGRAIDVGYRLEARELPVVIQGQVDKGYGGLNLRFAPRADTTLVTEVGAEPKDTDRELHEWADLSARFGGADEMSGIAIFVSDDHPEFPAPWTLRYYGDLNVAWPGLAPFTLAPGEPVELDYRLWVHRGDARAGRVGEAYAAYRDRRR